MREGEWRFIETLLFYAILAACLMVTAEVSRPVLRLSFTLVLFGRPLFVFVCALLAAAQAGRKRPFMALMVGVLAATFYELAMFAAVIILAFPGAGLPDSLALQARMDNFRQYVVFSTLMSVAAGALAAALDLFGGMIHGDSEPNR